MSEKLFELLIITIAGGVVADIIASSINDGVMPKRRWAGLLIFLLIIVIGVCVYFEIPVLSTIFVFIANTPWWFTACVVCSNICISIAIYKSIQRRSLFPVLIELGCILLLGLTMGIGGVLGGLQEGVGLQSGLLGWLLGGLLGAIAGLFCPE